MRNGDDNKKNVYDVLVERGYIETTTDSDKISKLLNSGTTIYQGFDPSADSFHLGNLLGVMVLHYLQKAGNKIIILLGGATGIIGDPSGKSTTRVMLTNEIVKKNADKIKKQVENMSLIEIDGKKGHILNNYDWISPKKLLDFFLVEVASKFSVNDMVKMDTFKRRLDAEEHLSLLEFLYPTLQALDFLHLYDNYDCKIQLGGNDQWTNILAGVNLIKSHKGNSAEAQAITTPLLVNSSGEKMGKTASGPLWLNPDKTSPFEFFQYLEKVPDDKVEDLFKLFTFLELEEISEIVKGNPRKAQQKLAYEVTKIVHGEDIANKVVQQSEVLHSESATESLEDFPEYVAKKSSFLDDALVDSGSLMSKSEVKRRCEGGAVSVDGAKLADPKTILENDCIIKYGKGKFLKVSLR